MPKQPPSREAIIEAARDIMAQAGQCAMVTVGPDGAPQARMMDPFTPDDDLTVWMATSRDTRKVEEVRADDRVTLIWFAPADPGYATLIGAARLVDDVREKRARWKEEWREYYPGGPDGPSYLLMQFFPRRLEVVSKKHDIAADPLAWEPAVVELDPRLSEARNNRRPGA